MEKATFCGGLIKKKKFGHSCVVWKKFDFTLFYFTIGERTILIQYVTWKFMYLDFYFLNIYLYASWVCCIDRVHIFQVQLLGLILGLNCAGVKLRVFKYPKHRVDTVIRKAF